ncbi:MAG: hypothetical protein IJ142_04230 [Bacteroidaceae bacterium]|nr:hypothetical protein [Bacteroidaceae bacterium]
MTRKEIIDRLESVEREVKEIREYLSQNDGEQVAPRGFPLPLESDFMVGYTLEDLYREFGKKKSLAYRLKSALKNGISKPWRNFCHSRQANCWS